jgi:hypothetical protein
MPIKPDLTLSSFLLLHSALRKLLVPFIHLRGCFCLTCFLQDQLNGVFNLRYGGYGGDGYGIGCFGGLCACRGKNHDRI